MVNPIEPNHNREKKKYRLGQRLTTFFTRDSEIVRSDSTAFFITQRDQLSKIKLDEVRLTFKLKLLNLKGSTRSK